MSPAVLLLAGALTASGPAGDTLPGTTLRSVLTLQPGQYVTWTRGNFTGEPIVTCEGHAVHRFQRGDSGRLFTWFCGAPDPEFWTVKGDRVYLRQQP